MAFPRPRLLLLLLLSLVFALGFFARDWLLLAWQAWR